jgi:hypothetical protein
LEMGSLRALILNPFCTCDTVDSDTEGYGSLMAPLKDIVATE